ncbi:MAG TPA: Rho termination factor N-terminal domain-containing protein [Fodinibius sp.]|nr:Rho termination factor N-terminal domain-containing protein [Fodinibius sp.]
MMSKQDPNQIKDQETYEELREQGMSKDRAARIANAGRQASRKGGKHGTYEDWTKNDLLEKAGEVGIEGRSKMNKHELIKALRDH